MATNPVRRTGGVLVVQTDELINRLKVLALHTDGCILILLEAPG